VVLSAKPRKYEGTKSRHVVRASGRDRRCGALEAHALRVRVRVRGGIRVGVRVGVVHGTAGRGAANSSPNPNPDEGANLQRHHYLGGVEAGVVVVELARLAQVREELACRVRLGLGVSSGQHANVSY
jgi:hypothetical protein